MSFSEEQIRSSGCVYGFRAHVKHKLASHGQWLQRRQTVNCVNLKQLNGNNLKQLRQIPLCQHYVTTNCNTQSMWSPYLINNLDFPDIRHYIHL